MPNDCRIFSGRPPAPAAATLAELRDFEVMWLAEAMTVGLMSPEIRALYDPMDGVVGTAVTVRTAPGDFKVIPWAVDQLGPNDVLVVDGAGDSSRAVWGDYVSARAKSVGCNGVVIDGSVRDVDGIRELGLPVYTRHTTPRGPTRLGPGDVNVPVSCGGVSVSPGDVVVADRSGIVVVRAPDLEWVMDSARQRGEREARMRRANQTMDWAAYLTRLADGQDPPKIYDRCWNE